MSKRTGDHLVAHKLEQVETRQRKIDILLSDIPNSEKSRFKNFTHLSEYLAKKLSESGGKRVHGSTLRRNPNYASALKLFLKENGKSKLAKPSIEEENLALKLELNVKKIEIATLKKSINESFSKQSHLEQESFQMRSSSMNNTLPEETQKAFCLIKKLIEYLGFAEIDLVNGIVIDSTNDEVIFSETELTAFFDYLRAG